MTNKGSLAESVTIGLIIIFFYYYYFKSFFSHDTWWVLHEKLEKQGGYFEKQTLLWRKISHFDNVPSGCTRIVLPMLYNGVCYSIVLGCILSL